MIEQSNTLAHTLWNCRYLILHNPEEVLHQGVVHAVALPGEGLKYI